MAAAKHLSFAKHPVGAITAPALQLSTIKPHAQHFLPPIFTSKLPFFYPSIFNHENHEKYESCALPISLPQRHRGELLRSMGWVLSCILGASANQCNNPPYNGGFTLFTISVCPPLCGGQQ
jgi:hypothetical protein